MSDFFAMGGYGAYVWPAFGFAAAVLLGLLWQTWSGRGRRVGRGCARSAPPSGKPMPQHRR